jgi:uncharacterized protein YbgA (DUF1722 family)
VGRIILTDSPDYVPTTFADDSYAPSIQVSTVTVLAQFPMLVDFSWHFALLARLKRREVKYADFRRNLDSLSPDLVRSVYRGLRKAIIAISDDAQHRQDMTAILENIAGKTLDSLDPSIRAYFEEKIAAYADEMVLLHSPLWDVKDYLGEAETTNCI